MQVPEGVAVVAKGTWAALQGRKALKVSGTNRRPRRWTARRCSRNTARSPTQPGTNFVKPAATDPAPAAAVRRRGGLRVPVPRARADGADELRRLAARRHARDLGRPPVPDVRPDVRGQGGGLPRSKVKLHTLVSGGSFGRRANAGRTSPSQRSTSPRRSRAGRRCGCSTPARTTSVPASTGRCTCTRVKVGLDAKRQDRDWQHTVVGQSIMAGATDGDDGQGRHRSDLGRRRLADAVRVAEMTGDLHSPVLRCGRSGGARSATPTPAFVMETMMDELAVAAGKDPVAFRLALLDKNPRAVGVLKLAAEKAGWGKAMPAGSAQGIAVHESFGSFVAQVAEVSMKDGKVKVDRVVCAVDCGVAVNPDVIRAQMEGCIGFGLGAMLLQRDRGEERPPAAAQLRHATRSLRIHEMPKVEVHIVASTPRPPASASRACRRSRRRSRTRWRGSADRACAGCRSRARGWSRPERRAVAAPGRGAPACKCRPARRRLEAHCEVAHSRRPRHGPSAARIRLSRPARLGERRHQPDSLHGLQRARRAAQARARALLLPRPLVLRRPRGRDPKPGDFKRTVVGERSVILVRDMDGAVNVVENVARTAA